ncbi:MAG: DUF92 domain-containing protein [Conexivisphaerales archaeon]
MLAQQLALSLIGLALLGLISLASYRYRATDKGGTLTAFLMGATVGLAAGWLWVVYLIIFFAVATLATKFRYNYKSTLHAAEEKGGARGVKNVLANGGLAALFAVLHWFFNDSLLAVLFVASIASSLSDTLATEIGLLSKGKPHYIANPSLEVEPGRSGGITLLGLTAELIGSVLFGIFAYLIGIIGFRYIIVVVIAGMLGSNIDSLLGATLQGYYICQICGQRTEKSVHCSENARRVKGLSWIGNNAVNILSASFAALVALALQLAL